MRSYLHTNSAIMPPTMAGEALAIYRAIISGQPIRIERGHYTPEDLALVAERMRCDEAVTGLRRLGIDARVVDRERVLDLTYVEAAVRVGDAVAVDAEAALRICQRLEGGLTLDVALARTLAQCEQPVLSEHALRAMEREAEAVMRRLNSGELRAFGAEER